MAGGLLLWCFGACVVLGWFRFVFLCCPQAVPALCCVAGFLGCILGLSWFCLAHFSSMLEAFWNNFGASWNRFGSMLGHLGMLAYIVPLGCSCCCCCCCCCCSSCCCCSWLLAAAGLLLGCFCAATVLLLYCFRVVSGLLLCLLLPTWEHVRGIMGVLGTILEPFWEHDGTSWRI